MAESNECAQACHEEKWQIDDLRESELESILSLGDQDTEKDAVCRNRSITHESSVGHTFTWAPKLAAKRDPDRASLFDLPPEIRLTIYNFYKASLFRDFDLTDNRWPVHLFNFHADYLARILRTQLVCHQLHSELIPCWTQDMTLLLSYANFTKTSRHVHARMAQLKGTWLRIRRLLDWLGPVARYRVRTIRICYIYRFTDLLHWDHHLRVLEDRTAAELACRFERLMDVHEDLKVEVELRCDGRNSLPFLPARRVFFLQQLPFGRRDGPDWKYRCGHVERMMVNPYFGHIGEVYQRPHFKHCRDEVWQID